MGKIGKIAICGKCRQEKRIHKEFNGRLTCQECYFQEISCTCAVCKAGLRLASYHEHLIKDHKLEDLAKYLYEIEKNSNS